MAEHECRRENRFEHLAEMCRDEQQRVLDNDKEHLATALVLLRQRKKESAAIGPRHLIGANRCTDKAMVALSSIVHILHESPQAPNKYLCDTRRPAEPLVASLESHLMRLPHTRYDRHRVGPPSSWLRIVCRNRDVFKEHVSYEWIRCLGT